MGSVDRFFVLLRITQFFGKSWTVSKDKLALLILGLGNKRNSNKAKLSFKTGLVESTQQQVKSNTYTMLLSSYCDHFCSYFENISIWPVASKSAVPDSGFFF